ncbi:hypothetical protein [Nostoc sp. JL34]|uniref:hypothetical protein n=1 Tax=Nostoc sp. JL34 TaxID=2815397 RepID=UPI00345AC4E7
MCVLALSPQSLPLLLSVTQCLVITRVRDTEAEPDGPPWPLSDSELAQFESLGLQQVEKLEFLESELDVKQVRIEYQRHTSLTGS